MRFRVAAQLLLLNSVPALHFVFWYVAKYCSGSNSSGWHLVIVPLKIEKSRGFAGKRTIDLWQQLDSQKYNYMNHFLFNICSQKLRETNCNCLPFFQSWNLSIFLTFHLSCERFPSAQSSTAWHFLARFLYWDLNRMSRHEVSEKGLLSNRPLFSDDALPRFMGAGVILSCCWWG